MKNLLYFSLQMLSSRVLKTIVIIILIFLSFYLLSINISVLLDFTHTNRILEKQNFKNAYFFSYSNTIDINNSNQINQIDESIEQLPFITEISKMYRIDGFSDEVQELINVIMYDQITIEALNWEIEDGEWLYETDKRFIPGIVDKTYCPNIMVGDIIEVEMFDVVNQENKTTKSIKIIGLIDKEYFSLLRCIGEYTASEDIIESALQPTLLLPIVYDSAGQIIGNEYPQRIIWSNGNLDQNQIYSDLKNEIINFGSIANIYSMKNNQILRNNHFFQWEGLLCFVLTLITIVSIIGYNILLIEQEKRDIAIYLLCGMENKNIQQIFITHNIILSATSLLMLVSTFFVNLKINLLNIFYFEITQKLEVFLFTMIIYIIIYGLIIMYINNIIKKKSIIDLLRESEIW
ncbi:MAG: hypothetical protein KAG94_06845 [Clostridiales bacterium]|nr:hypothetical protein [Clostridiales bacterium]